MASPIIKIYSRCVIYVLPPGRSDVLKRRLVNSSRGHCGRFNTKWAFLTGTPLALSVCVCVCVCACATESHASLTVGLQWQQLFYSYGIFFECKTRFNHVVTHSRCFPLCRFGWSLGSCKSNKVSGQCWTRAGSSSAAGRLIIIIIIIIIVIIIIDLFWGNCGPVVFFADAGRIHLRRGPWREDHVHLRDSVGPFGTVSGPPLQSHSF